MTSIAPQSLEGKPFDKDDLRAALEWSSYAYDLDTVNSGSHLVGQWCLVCRREINLFLVRDPLRGLIFFDRTEQRAYVSFRGTVSNAMGNWVLTNAQIANRRFLVLDDSIDTSQGERLQGGSLKEILPGYVHQGFLRTWSRLWYSSTDIIFPPSDIDRHPVGRRFRYLAIFVGFAALGGYLARNLNTAWQIWFSAAMGVSCALIVAAVESGFMEKLLRQAPKASNPLNEPMNTFLHKLDKAKQVIFVGHSLGGALATLAFSAFMARHEKDLPMDPKRTRLITFGAPHVGDDEFVQSFEAKYRGQFLHVRNSGDPVTVIPPSPGEVGECLFAECGWHYGLFSIFLWPTFKAFMCTYRQLWGQVPLAAWSGQGSKCLKCSRGLCFFAHTRKSYGETVDSLRSHGFYKDEA